MRHCPHCGGTLYEKLTAEERRCIGLRADGYTTAQIAEEIGRMCSTVKHRIGAVHKKLGISHLDTHQRIYLARYWNCELFQIGLRELGLLPEPEEQNVAA